MGNKLRTLGKGIGLVDDALDVFGFGSALYDMGTGNFDEGLCGLQESVALIGTLYSYATGCGFPPPPDSEAAQRDEYLRGAETIDPGVSREIEEAEKAQRQVCER